MSHETLESTYVDKLGYLVGIFNKTNKKLLTFFFGLCEKCVYRVGISRLWTSICKI